MKNSIAVFILSLLVCAASAFAWPWGNVGLNVDEPTEQLDVGGSVGVDGDVIIRPVEFQGSHNKLIIGGQSKPAEIAAYRAINEFPGFSAPLAAFYDASDDDIKAISFNDGTLYLLGFGDLNKTNMVILGTIVFE